VEWSGTRCGLLVCARSDVDGRCNADDRLYVNNRDRTRFFLAWLGFDTVASVDHRVREAAVGDADALGRTHVRAWQAAYRGGLMPDDYLHGLDETERARMWRSSLANPPPPRSVRLVGESAAGVVAGFVLVGPAARDPASSVGELYAINVDPDSWGSGLGAGLIDRGVAALSDAGFTHAVLWVHPGNERARRFYAARGWSNDEVERRQTILGVEVPEVRYSLELTSA
jgi:ribosomal protein S18 acetylase RimI-like enzyme